MLGFSAAFAALLDDSGWPSAVEDGAMIVVGGVDCLIGEWARELKAVQRRYGGFAAKDCEGKPTWVCMEYYWLLGRAVSRRLMLVEDSGMLGGGNSGRGVGRMEVM